MDIKAIAEDVHKFEVARGEWDHIFQKTTSQRAALIMEEVSEVFKAYRNGHPSDLVYHQNGKPEGIPIELADIVLRVLATAEDWGVNIEESISLKMQWNWENRVQKEGK